MSRLQAVVIVAALLGCQAGPPATDPFLNPTRVPPPVTGDFAPIQPGMTPVPGGQPAPQGVAVPGNGYAPPAGGYNYGGAGSIYGNPAGSQGYGATPGYPTPATKTPGWGAPTAPQYTTPPYTAPPYTAPPAGTNPTPAQPGGSIYNRQSSYDRSASSPATSAATNSKDGGAVTVSRIDADRDPRPLVAADADPKGDTEIDDSRAILAGFVDDQDAPGERRAAQPRRSTRGSGPADRGETYGFDPNYAWLHGRLEFSQVENQWKLRYIPLDGATDRYGGSVILAEDSPLDGHQPGEFVSVAGAIASPAVARDGFAPTYHAGRIERLN